MRYYAASGALIGSGLAFITTGVIIWLAADSFVRRGEGFLLFPSTNTERIR